MQRFSDFVKMFFCTAFLFGLSPVIPGTVGTLPAVIIFIFISIYAAPFTRDVLTIVLFLGFSLLSVVLGKWAEQYWGQKDPRPFVLDEVASFFFTVMLFRVPSLAATVLWAFVMTRIFDIIKPPPAQRLESLPGGWGILTDDLVASVYAGVVLNLLAYLIPSFFDFS